MNEVVKSPVIIGLTGKLEGSYGAGGSLSVTTDGIQLAETPKLSLAYGFDGSRPAPPGSTGYQRRARPNGRTGTVPLKVEVKGAGAAYSSSVVPSIHILARIAGLEAALTATGGAEKYVYTRTPGPVGYASGVFNAWARGELYPLTAAYADWEMGGDDTGVVYFSATVQALVGAITDALTPPAITYPLAGVLPPTSAGASLFTFGSFVNANLRKWKLKGGRSISPRLNQNAAGGHAGFAVGRSTPTLEVTFETPALTTTPFHAASALDPYNLFDSATELAWSLVIGATQYNKCTAAGAHAQLMAAPQTDEDGDVVTTTLQLQLNPSAANLADELALTFD